MAVVYREAWELKKEQRNYETWWQGFYIYEALESALSELFSKKGKKPYQYPKEPHRITPLTEEEKQEKIEETRRQLFDYFRQKQAAFNNGRIESQNQSRPDT